LPECPPTLAGFDIAGGAYPAEFTCGDTFDYLTLVDGSLGLVIGDVMGHGFAPSLLMASTHAYLRSLGQTSADVSTILTLTNRILVDETKENCFVTLLLGRLDPQARTFTYCSAGHPTGYVLDASGRVKSYLKSTGLPLGIFRDAEFPAVGPLLLESGDLFLLITDGVLESQSPAGEQFRAERMLDTVRSHRHQPSHAIIEKLYRTVLDFSQKEKPSDDVTIVVVKVNAQEENPHRGRGEARLLGEAGLLEQTLIICPPILLGWPDSGGSWFRSSAMPDAWPGFVCRPHTGQSPACLREAELPAPDASPG
jgi:sigma-B regulation protein RsbU (phosphoserine phosphatase)